MILNLKRKRLNFNFLEVSPKHKVPENIQNLLSDRKEQKLFIQILIK